MTIRITSRADALMVSVTLLALLGMSASLIAGQKPAPKTTSPASPAAPKTPWGDPDLQGTWSGDSAFAIPMQRPEALGTKGELTDQEFADKAARDEQARKRAVGAVGSFRNDGAWLDKTFRQTSLIVEPANGRTPPLTPEAERQRALAPRGTYGNGPLDGPEDFTLYDRCISLGAVGSMTPKIYGNGYRIIQAPGYVAVLAEMIHEARIVPLAGQPHVGKKIQTYLGDSRGHWEGNTLVVETTNLNGKTNYSALNMTLVERFTRVEPDVLRYEAIVDDPTTYTTRVKISIPFTSPPGYRVLPYECHEGNHAVLQGLGGERAEDAALAADAKRGIIRPRRPIQGGLTVGGQAIPEGGPAQN
jgi:hypothetical protein